MMMIAHPLFAPAADTAAAANLAPRAAVRRLVRALLVAEPPAAERGEDVAEEGPERGEVRDVDGPGGFADIPGQVDVGDKGGDEAVDFGDDGGDDDEDAHAEDDEEDGFLLQGDADAEEEGEADEEDQDVGRGVEDAFGDFVVLVGGALGYGSGGLDEGYVCVTGEVRVLWGELGVRGTYDLRLGRPSNLERGGRRRS